MEIIVVTNYLHCETAFRENALSVTAKTVLKRRFMLFFRALYAREARPSFQKGETPLCIPYNLD